MRCFEYRWRGRAGGLSLVATLALIGCPPAMAAGLSGGSLTFSTFPAVTLDGAQQTTSAVWNIASIADASATADGWHDSLTLSQLKEYDLGITSYVTGGYTLPNASITVAMPPTVAAESGGQSVTVTTVAFGTALDTGNAVSILSATIQRAIAGTQTFTFNSIIVALRIPASA